MINDSDCKSTASTVTTSNNHHTSSTLSADLLTRLSFNNTNQSAPQTQVVRFNKDSLNDAQSSKVIVSSTTSDDLDESENPFRSNDKKVVSLKRKSADNERKTEKPLGYMGLLKTDGNQSGNASSGRTLSLNDRIKITNTSGGNLTKLTGITVTTAGAGVDSSKNKSSRLAMDEEIEQQQSTDKLQSKVSVFNRIKTVSNRSDETKSEEKPASKVIPLNKNKTSIETNGAKKMKSIHDRLSFN